MENQETPVTFREPCFVLFDTKQNAVRTTQFGNLAIFSVRAMAEHWAEMLSRSKGEIRVIPVMITPLAEA